MVLKQNTYAAEYYGEDAINNNDLLKRMKALSSVEWKIKGGTGTCQWLLRVKVRLEVGEHRSRGHSRHTEVLRLL